MIEYQIPYGVAVTLRVGSLRDADSANKGAFVTPTFAAGDVVTEQDDGSGFENADDPTPDLDGTSVELDVSATEAAVPAALAGRRIYRIDDQTAPKVWVPREFAIVTRGNSHLAAFPDGVLRSIVPQSVAATSLVGPNGLVAAFVPAAGMVLRVWKSDNALDIGHTAVITGVDNTAPTAPVISFASGWTRTPTGTAASMEISIVEAPPRAAAVAIANEGAGAAAPDVQADVAVALAAYPVAKPASSQGQGAGAAP